MAQPVEGSALNNANSGQRNDVQTDLTFNQQASESEFQVNFTTSSSVRSQSSGWRLTDIGSGNGGDFTGIDDLRI